MALTSTTARLMVSPFRGYARLAAGDDPDGAPTVFAGVSRLLLFHAAFIAITATGRLAPIEIVLGAVSLAWVPGLAAVAVAAALRAWARHVALERAFALYLEGMGPYFAFFLLVSAGCLLASDPAALLLRAAPPLVLVTIGWGGLLTFAFFRSGLGLPRGRAAGATATFYGVVVAAALGYFVAAGQLLPILPS